MIGKEFTFVLPSLSESEFPEIRRPRGASICCLYHEHGEIEIVGNSEGLVYLAKHLLAMGLIENYEGLHIHLDPECNDLDYNSKMVTICNVDFRQG